MLNNNLTSLRRTFSAFILIPLFILISNSSSAAIKSYKKEADGITCILDKGLMKIKICQADIVEVKYTIFNAFPQFESLVVNNKWVNKPDFKVTSDNKFITVITQKLKLIIDRTTNSITYFDSNGRLLTSEDKKINKNMLAETIAGIDTYNCSTQFNSPSDEALYGLGCHPEDTLSINYKGRNQEMLIKYMTGAIPVLLSTKGYGLMWDNYSASNFYGAEAGNTKYKYVSESGRQVDYYFFYGPSFDHIIDLYRTATGKAPMFGKWAFGLFQSQDQIGRAHV